MAYVACFEASPNLSFLAEASKPKLLSRSFYAEASKPTLLSRSLSRIRRVLPGVARGGKLGGSYLERRPHGEPLAVLRLCERGRVHLRRRAVVVLDQRVVLPRDLWCHGTRLAYVQCVAPPNRLPCASGTYAYGVRTAGRLRDSTARVSTALDLDPSDPEPRDLGARALALLAARTAARALARAKLQRGRA